MRPQTPLLIAIVGCVLAAPGCVFDQAELWAEASGLESQSQRLVADGLAVDWSRGGSWDGGGCVSLQVSALSTDLSDWQAHLQVSPTIDSWVEHGGNGNVTPLGDARVAIFPDSGWLSVGEQSGFYYCSEPLVLPVSLEARTIAADGSTSGGSGSGGSSGSGSGGSGGSGSGSGGSGGSGEYGGYTSDGWQLTWTDAGSSRGGDCLELTLTNNSGESVEDWWANVTLGRAASVTDAWGLGAFTFDSHSLWLVPIQYEDSPVEHGDSTAGVVCLDPSAEPIDFRMYTEGNHIPGGDDGGDDGGGDDGGDRPDIDLNGELLDPDSGWAVRFSDGGYTETEHCVNLMFANLSGTDASDWSGTIEVDGNVEITRSWTIQGFASGTSTIRFIVDDYAKNLDHGDVAWGGLCMRPVARPIGLDVNAVP